MLIGGNPSWHETHILNIEDGYWSQLPDAPVMTGSGGCAAGAQLEHSFNDGSCAGVFEGQRGVFVVGGYGDGETATIFFDLDIREWRTLPDLPAGGGVTLSNPGGLAGEHPLVLGGNLEDQVLEFDGSAWRALEVKLTSRDNGQSTTVSQEFASWLRTLDQVSIFYSVKNQYSYKILTVNFLCNCRSFDHHKG